jgi:hypothetical protein
MELSSILMTDAQRLGQTGVACSVSRFGSRSDRWMGLLAGLLKGKVVRPGFTRLPYNWAGTHLQKRYHPT